MKKLGLVLSLLLVLTFAITGCGAAKEEAKESKKLIVAASPLPHAQILDLIKPKLEEKGIELEVKEITDYATPNVALDSKEVDANFFQHQPYLDEFNKNNNMDLVSVAKVHVEPIGAYSQKIKSIDELKDGAVVGIPNDPSNEGRALLLLQAQGLIKLKDESGLTQTPKDIVENPKNIQFKELEAAQLPRVLQDVEFAIINTNIALEANLDPGKDAIFIEGKDSPYANILVARPDNKDSEVIKELINLLNSDEVKKFIEEEYKGAVVPAF